MSSFTPSAAALRNRGGEQTREQVLAAAAEERKARAEQRRQRDAASRIQRYWRACHAYSSARTEFLAAWQQRWGCVDRVAVEEVSLLLSPLLFCARRRRDGTYVAESVATVGAPALARAFALFLPNCKAWLSICEKERGAQHVAASLVALASAAVAEPPVSQNPAVFTAVGCRVVTSLTEPNAWPTTASAEYRHLLRRSVAPCAHALGRLLRRGGEDATSGNSTASSALLAVLLRALQSPDDGEVTQQAADALVAGVMCSPRGLASAPPAVLVQLRQPLVLRPLFHAIASRRPASDVDAAWTVAHAVQLLPSHGDGDAETMNAFLGAVSASLNATGHRHGAPAMLRAVAAGILRAGSSAETACEALKQAASALESPMLLQLLLDAGSPIASIASFYWPMLHGDQADDASATGISRIDALRVLNTLAFSARGALLPTLWRHCAQQLGIRESLDKNTAAQTLAPPTLCTGVSSVPATCASPFGVFVTAFEHLLFVLDDDEFHNAQRPLPLTQTRAVTAAVNTLVVCTHLPHSRGATASHALTSSSIALLEACTKLLRSLVARNARRRYCDEALWLAPALHAVMHVPAAARAFAAAQASAVSSAAEGNNTVPRDLLVSAPHSRPFSERAAVFRQLCSTDRQKWRASAQPGGVDAGQTHVDSAVAARVVQLTVRRSHLLEDSLSGLSRHSPDELRGRLFVRFVNAAGASEAGIDQGGLFKEWLTNCFQELADPRRGLFKATPDGALCVSPAAAVSHEGRMLLNLTGLVMGKALYEGVLLDVALAPFLVAQLLRQPLSLDDLPALDRELHRSLIAVKSYAGDVADLCLDFTASTDDGAGGTLTTDLIPGGADVPVTNDNRLAYVAAVADWRLRGAVEPGVAALRASLAALVPPQWLALFLPAEVNTLLSGGAADYDVADLAAHCQYANGYGPSSRTVLMFFDVLKGFTAQQRALVLKFTTSCSKPPYGGFKHLQPPFTIAKVDVTASFFAAIAGPDVERLPSASTCFCRLNLPNYRRASTLREKLLMAITSGSGFDLS